MCHAPSNVSVVSEMHDERHSGDRVTEDIEFWCTDMDLVIDVGNFEAAVRVAADHGQSGRSEVARDGPPVGSSIDLP